MELENIIDIELDDICEVGPQGLSAYEVYLKNGGTLSEEEWLESLKGNDGEPGPTYTAGENITIDENNVISASGGDCNVFTVASPYSVDPISGPLLVGGSTYGSAFVDAINNFNKTGKLPIILVNFSTSSTINCLTFSMAERYTSQVTSYKFESNVYSKKIGNGSNIIGYQTWTVSGNWENDVFTRSGDIRVSRSYKQIIDTENTFPYTPTADYHPATKKYVDDSITSAITTVLEGEY